MSIGVTTRDAVATPSAAPTVQPGAKVFEELLSRIRNRTALIGIIGLGYVGLPLARTFSARGFPVLGFDIDPLKVEKLLRGESYIGHIGPDTIRQMLEQKFAATTDFARLREADAIII